MDLYAENILDHHRHPRNKKTLSAPTIRHNETNVSCGDALTLELQIENDVVTDVGWSGEGCAISQAGMSLLSEELMGSPLARVDELTRGDVESMLGVPVGPRRFKCALLGLHALRNALNVYREKPVQGWLETVALENGE